MHIKFFFHISFPLILLISRPLFASEEYSALLKLSLEELLNITVTSEKRPEKLQSISTSITAFNEKKINTWSITTIQDLSYLVPGLIVGQSGYDPRPAMRGVRTQQVEHNDTAISIYQDGINRPRHSQAMIPYLDIERIEVLRGPQGTMFGRNSFGGTVHTITNKPSTDYQDGSVHLGYGDYHQKKINGYINQPLSEKSALRLSLLAEQRDPFVENIFNSSAGMKDKNTALGRFQWLFNPTQELQFLISTQYWHEDSNGNGAFGYNIEGVPLDTQTNSTHPLATLVPRVGRHDRCTGACGRYGAGLDFNNTIGADTSAMTTPNPYQIAHDYQPTQKIDEKSFNTESKLSLDKIDLKLITGYLDFEDYRLEDADFSYHSSTIEGYQLNSQSTSIELQINSKNGSKHEWVSGFYYLYEDLDYTFLWMDLIDLKNNSPDPSSTPKNEWASWLSQLRMKTHSYSVFGQNKYKFSSKSKAILGLRHTSDRRTWNLFGQDPNNLKILNFSIPQISESKHSWSSLTWKLGIEHQYNKNSLLYLHTSTGFLSGNYKNKQDSYDEQKVTAYEMGLKSKLTKNLRLNFSLYLNKYTDLLATEFTDVGGSTLGIVDNAGAIDAQGLEFEVDYSFHENSLLGVRGEISKTEYGSFVTNNPYQSGGFSVNGKNFFQLDGLDVALSPNFSLTTFLQHSVTLSNASTLLFIPYFTWVDDYRASDEPYAYSNQDSFFQINFNLIWQIPKYQLTHKFFIKNLSNEAILLRANRFGGDIAATDYGNPRMFGIQTQYQF